MTMDRRHFMGGIAGAVGGPLLRPVSISAVEVAPETTAVTLAKTPALCTAPQFIAEELLRAEGFTEIRYVETIAPDVPSAVGAGKVDFSMAYTSQFVAAIDAGEAVTLLGGIMVGCFELFGGDNVRSIGDLKGKTVGVQAIGSQPHTLVTLMAAQVGLDPKTDIRFVTDPKLEADRAVRCRQDRRFSRLPARAAGIARTQDRPRAGQHRTGSAVVAVFLLPAGR